MKLSIAMATFNGGRFLREQLMSFVEQSRLPDELVICDDHSTDDTLEILHEFKKTAPFPIRIEVNQYRLGPTLNFNRALSMTTGDVVLLSDQDDVWYPCKLEKLATIAAEYPSSYCIINDASLVDRNLHSAGTTKMEQIRLAQLPPSAMVMGCCAAFRRQLLEITLPIPKGNWAHDNWLIQTADLLGVVYRSGDVLQVYRRHGANVSDFFVNRLAAPNFWERRTASIKQTWRRALNPSGLDAELAFLRASGERLHSRRDWVRALVGERTEMILSNVDAKIQRLSRRQGLRGLPRRSRIRRLITMWKNGDYLEGGCASALKDLLIQRCSNPKMSL